MAKEIKSNYKVIGVMAGSSMDGLDIAEVSFSKQDRWVFKIGKHQTVEYDSGIAALLRSAVDKDLSDQEEVDIRFGEWIASRLDEFGTKLCDLIAVHGHTLIHKPNKEISWQLGRGDVIATKTTTPVVSEFRTMDVQLGGQGAPLVPIGDFELFDEYDACLNLGGISNASIRKEKMAWDICPCNQVLNVFANRLGHLYDDRGNLARKGKMDSEWLKEISSIPFFKEAPPKSLPNVYISQQILDSIDPLNGLRSYSQFVADQTISDLKVWLPSDSRVLVSGGGALNSYLIELLNQNGEGFRFELPSRAIIEFKEALIFGFLGLLRWRNETNVLASVTGSSRDSCSGIIHYPK